MSSLDYPVRRKLSGDSFREWVDGIKKLFHEAELNVQETGFPGMPDVCLFVEGVNFRSSLISLSMEFNYNPNGTFSIRRCMQSPSLDNSGYKAQGGYYYDLPSKVVAEDPDVGTSFYGTSKPGFDNTRAVVTGEIIPKLKEGRDFQNKFRFQFFPKAA